MPAAWKSHRSSASRRRVVFGMAATLLWACSGSITDVTPSVGGTISEISINPPSATIAVGAQIPLAAIATDPTGKTIASAPIVWTVRDTAIASISASGMLVGRAIGSTQVAASANGKSGVALITVQKTPVNSVVVRPNRVDAIVGVKAQLTAIAYDAALNPLPGRPVTWTSSDELVATVDPTGNVTARSAGSATITGTSEGKSDVSTITVTQAPVAAIAVVPSSLAMSVGQTTQLAATLRDASGNVLTGRAVAWSSSDVTIATVTADGLLTAVTAGSVVVTAKSEGQTATSAVTVSTFAVGEVSVQPQQSTIPERGSTQLSVTVRDVTGAVTVGRVVTWTSSNTAIATVSSTGLVTGVTPGSVTITAASEGKSNGATVNVVAAPVASITLSPAAPTIVVGQTVTLTPTLKDATGVVLTNRVVTWSSSNTSIATVSTGGVVTAVATGTATITATSETKSATAQVTVALAPVGAVVVGADAPTVFVGSTLALAVSVRDASGNPLTGRVVSWTTDNAAIATVSSEGVVTGVAAGAAKITAASEGKTGSATVTVVPVPVATVAVAPTSLALVPGQTGTLGTTLKDANGNTLTDRTVTWSSGTPAVATVSSSGVVTAVAVGTAVITATSEGKQGAATVTVSPAPVANVVLAPSAPTITVGQTTTLVATVTDASNNALTGRSVTWSSSATGVVTVSSTGLVTGVAAGTATITGTSEGKSGTATVTVTLVPIASVTVAPTTLSLVVGQTGPLTATVKDANGNVLTGRTVTWTSGNTGVATVSSSGVVTAVAAGSATITAASGGQQGTASVTVTNPAPAPVATVTLAPTTLSLTVGQTGPLTPTLKDANGNVLTGRTVTWSSDTPGVATVSTSGVVTAVAAGTATITATSEGKSGTASVTVTLVPVASVTVAPTTLSLVVGQTGPLTATLKDANGNVLTGRTVTWTSGTTGVATVSSSGVVTAVAAGTATITASSGGQQGTASVTVTNPAPVPVATVTLAPPTLSLTVGQTGTLTPTLKDANGNVLTGRTVTWSSDTPGVATVSTSGVVTAIGAGTATITATSEGKSGTASVTVTLAPVATVTLAPTTLSLVVAQTGTLTATLKDANNNVLTGRTITWSSGTPGVATVSTSGVVTAVAAGSATITATSEGKTGTATVTVTIAPVANVALAPSAPSITVGQTTTLVPTLTDANGNTLTGRVVTWSSSATGVATVSTSGVVTGVAAGTATITATSEGKTGTATVTVTPVPVATVTVAPTTLSLVVPQTGTLTATLKDANGNVLTGRTVTWTSGTPGVATVSSSGVVTAVGAGSATITATSEGKTGTATVTVTLAPVATVTLAPTTLGLVVAQTGTLTATLKDANNNVLTGRTITWSSGTPGVATVSTSGVVTAVAPGTATITATSETKSGTAQVTVTVAPVANVVLAPSAPSIGVGQTTTLVPTLTDANGNTLTGRVVTWSSSATGVATVSTSGVVTGVAAGTATITATSEGKTGTATVTVLPPPVATVTVAPLSANVGVGATTTLSATLKDANGNVLTGRTITWSSGTPGVATVSATGVVTGVTLGTASITATSEGKSASAAITVIVGAVATVTVTPSPLSMKDGTMAQLTAVAKDVGGNVVTGRPVSWQTSDGGKASVNGSGVVTAKNVGTVTITATIDGKSGSTSVTVTP